jgi:hypothetical protein
MTETAEAEAPEVVQAETPAPKPGPRRKPARPPRRHGDPDQYLMTAKRLAVENYNRSRDQETTEELTMDGVYIVWFSKTLKNWKAIVASPIVFGIMWEISYNGALGEAYIDVYKKVTNVKVPMRGKKS